MLGSWDRASLGQLWVPLFDLCVRVVQMGQSWKWPMLSGYCTLDSVFAAALSPANVGFCSPSLTKAEKRGDESCPRSQSL